MQKSLDLVVGKKKTYEVRKSALIVCCCCIRAWMFYLLLLSFLLRISNINHHHTRVRFVSSGLVSGNNHTSIARRQKKEILTWMYNKKYWLDLMKLHLYLAFFLFWWVSIFKLGPIIMMMIWNSLRRIFFVFVFQLRKIWTLSEYYDELVGVRMLPNRNRQCVYYITSLAGGDPKKH